MKTTILSLTAAVLMPAVSHAAQVVTTTVDELDTVSSSGTGVSLREALRDAPVGDTVTFSPALFNGEPADTIVLNNEIVLTRNVSIDASGIAAGVTIDAGPGLNRHFHVTPARVVSMNRLTLTGGQAVGATFAHSGGAIYSEGNLTMTDCSLIGNSARDWGSGIYNEDLTLTMIRCTIIGPTLSGLNSSTTCGGGIFNYGNLVMDHCTISGCTASRDGGAIFNGEFGNTHLTLTHCTITGNRAFEHGGGIYSRATESNLEYCIVANNSVVTSGGGSDVYNNDEFNLFGTNIIPVIVNVAPGSISGDAPLTASPQLAAPAANGGLTLTCAIPATSPAVNAATGSTAAQDQRGMPTAGVPDIGAFEYQPPAPPPPPDYPTWIAANLPAGASAAERDATFDYDKDGVTNGDEWVAVTNPNNGASFLQAGIASTSGSYTVSFPTWTGRTYSLRYSTDLSGPGWQNSGLTPIAGDGSVKSFTVPAAGVPRRFYSVVVTAP